MTVKGKTLVLVGGRFASLHWLQGRQSCMATRSQRVPKAPISRSRDAEFSALESSCKFHITAALHISASLRHHTFNPLSIRPHGQLNRTLRRTGPLCTPTWKKLALDVLVAAHPEAPSSDLEIEKTPPDPTTKTKDLAPERKSWRNNFVNVLKLLAPARCQTPSGDACPRSDRLSSVSVASSRASSPARSADPQSKPRRDSGYSRRSQHSRKSQSRADEEAEERRKRRRGEDIYRRDRTPRRRDDVPVIDAVVETTEGTMLQLPAIIGPVRHHPPAALNRDRYDSYYDDRRATTAQVIAIAAIPKRQPLRRRCSRALQEGVEAATIALPSRPIDRVVALQPRNR